MHDRNGDDCGGCEADYGNIMVWNLEFLSRLLKDLQSLISHILTFMWRSVALTTCLSVRELKTLVRSKDVTFGQF